MTSLSFVANCVYAYNGCFGVRCYPFISDLSLSRKNLNQPKPKQSKKKKSDKPPIPPPQPPSKVSSSLLYGYMCSLPAKVLRADASVFIMLGPALILRFCIKLTINFNNKIAEVIVFVRSVS